MSITRRTMIKQAATVLVGAVATGGGAVALAEGSRQKETPRHTGEIKPVWTKPALAPGEAGLAGGCSLSHFS